MHYQYQRLNSKGESQTIEKDLFVKLNFPISKHRVPLSDIDPNDNSVIFSKE